MKFFGVLCILFFFVINVEGKSLASTLCPVTGENVVSNASLIFNGGQTIFFCCNDCFAAFVKNTLGYVQEKQHPIPHNMIGKTLICPVTGNSFQIVQNNARIEFDYGQTLYFCCSNCLKPFEANPDSFIEQPQ